jgi:hypothetical protein
MMHQRAKLCAGASRLEVTGWPKGLEHVRLSDASSRFFHSVQALFLRKLKSLSICGPGEAPYLRALVRAALQSLHIPVRSVRIMKREWPA